MKTDVNNGFLWILALVPLAWILQMLLFVAIPLGCSLREAFVLGEYVSDHAFDNPALARIFWPSVIWALVVDTLFYVLDEMEVRKRGFDLGGRLKRYTAYLIAPMYLWIRGAPYLNNGARNLLPYAVWWIGAVAVCYFESGCIPAVASAAIAVAPCAALLCREGKKKAGIALFAFAGLAAAGCFSSCSAPEEAVRQEKWAEPISLAGVPNLHKVDDRLYRSAQPTAEGMTNLVSLGIKTVVNLRDNHSDSDEIGGLPLAARRIEIFTANMKEEHAREFLSIVDDTNAVPVLVHCQHGADRTGTMCAMYRIKRQGWTADEAIVEMENGGYGFHAIWLNLPRFIRKHAAVDF
ncbi:MAG: tyrosine-protein phosphatase [Kiritimatiellae bacterium]|nr:tyrosine-protein phosphatase [Kiritimatiellia bacterium]